MHDWLTAWRGGERVLQVLASWLPNATIYTLVVDEAVVPPSLRHRRIRTSWLQHLPYRRQFRWTLPLFPWTIERFRFSGYDVVISISHSVAKGVRTNGTCHVSYCLTPMRYAWICPETYLGAAVRARWSPQHALLQHLRRWDVATLDRVTQFIAISQTVRTRIQAYYERDAQVVYPPVNCAPFARVVRVPRDYYLLVSALVLYKRTDVAIQAFNQLRRPLVIVGTGPEEPRLRRLAGPTVTFVGWQSEEELAQWYAGARALIYPQEEDFGLAAVEAQAAGCPVIALQRGGATETVLDSVTGLLFDEQTSSALAAAVERHDRVTMDPHHARQQASRFNEARFLTSFNAAVTDALSRHRGIP